MSNKGKEKYISVLQKYVPSGSEEYLYELLCRHPLDFSVVKPRKTKLGDFRFPFEGKKAKITVNGNLNPYSFLITTLHEIAHFFAFLEFGKRIKAHGKEWQTTYRGLLLPFIDRKIFPKDIENALVNSLVKVKASSCTDLNLYRVLHQYDEKKVDTLWLENLAYGDAFELDERVFIKGRLRRKRYLCTERNTQKQYLVSPVATVKKIEL